MSSKLIGAILAAAFAVLLLILVGVGWLGLTRMGQIHAQVQDIGETHWTKVRLATEAMQYSSNNNRLTMQVFLMTDRREIDVLLARRAENSAKITGLLRRLGAMVQSTRERELLAAVEQARTPYVDSYKQAINMLLNEGQRDRARERMVTITLPRLLEYHAAWQEFVQFQRDEMDRGVKESEDQYVAARHLAWYLIALASVVAAATAVFVTHKLMEEISRRGRAERATHQLNAELEHKVEERTAALSTTNQALTAEITVRKQAQDHLRVLSLAVEQSPVSVVITDPRGAITYVNRKFSECTGYSQLEVLGCNPRILKSGLTPSAEYKMLWGAIANGRQWHGEFCNRKKNGDLYWESAVISPLVDAEGRTGHFVAIKEDITERKMLENQLQQAQKLEAIGQLAAGIAHEINTPIQYIGDNTAFIKESWAALGPVLAALRGLWINAANRAPTPAALAEFRQLWQSASTDFLESEIPHAVEQSLEGVSRVAKIVRAMKEFSHPGSEGRAALEINKAIETTITIARGEWKNVADLETQFAPDLPPVPCYGGEFNQVILNLIVNAAHAIEEVVGGGSNAKGRITIGTRRNGPWAEIWVSDTGGGIPERARSRIFEPFFTTKPEGKGTGQGLALAHTTIVKKHGGRIYFETATGKGTTFYVLLPLEVAVEDPQVV